jgi:short subunit dehydrogenase-like uncharacterized protein
MGSSLEFSSSRYRGANCTADSACPSLHDDAASLETVASKANTIVSFAGPFALCGMPIVDACVKCGTDYCDVTGEPTFVRAVVAGAYTRPLFSST